MRPLLAVGGPTATGKTVLAVELARRLGAELVNADSRQVARRLTVGTARPTAAELGGVRCHLLDLCEPGAPFSVADWLRAARAAVDDAAARGVELIVVGGTGQYLRALREGWVLGGGAPDPRVRAELTATAATPAGLEELGAELRRRDPDGAATIDLANPRRVVRAVEQLRAGAPSLAAARRTAGGVAIDLVVLDADPAAHRAAVDERVAAMFRDGAIVGEARAELARGTDPAAIARAGIGYTEALEVLAGRSGTGAAAAAALVRTRRYAKAQRTWFRHEPAAARLVRTATTTSAALADSVLAAVRAARAPTR